MPTSETPGEVGLTRYWPFGVGGLAGPLAFLLPWQ
jgi:hypothetical protein